MHVRAHCVRVPLCSQLAFHLPHLCSGINAEQEDLHTLNASEHDCQSNVLRVVILKSLRGLSEGELKALLWSMFAKVIYVLE